MISYLIADPLGSRAVRCTPEVSSAYPHLSPHFLHGSTYNTTLLRLSYFLPPPGEDFRVGARRFGLRVPDFAGAAFEYGGGASPDSAG